MLCTHYSYGQTITCACAGEGAIVVTLEFNGACGSSITSSSNIFNATNPDFPIGTSDLVSMSDGMAGCDYSVTFQTSDSEPFNLTIDGGAIVVDETSPELATCFNPEVTVSGSQSICPDEQSATFYSAVSDQDLFYDWSIDGGRTITYCGDPNIENCDMVTVNWAGALPGMYTITLVVSTDYDAASMMQTGCMETIEYPVFVSDGTPGVMVCNNSVNVSMNQDCSLTLSADMFLENMPFPEDAYTIALCDLDENPIPLPTIGNDFIGDTLIVKVSERCTGNSCWSKMVIEDKTAPVIECAPDVTIDCDELDENTGFPTNITLSTYLGNDRFELPGFDNCGDAFLTFTDVQTSALCDDPDFSAIIERTWIVTDEYGGFGTCITTIFINKATVAGVVWPADFDPAFGTDALLPKPCGTWIELENGHPSPESTGFPSGTFCLNVQVGYTDTRFDGCSENSFKIIRKWIVEDICGSPADAVTHNQNIVVMDNEAPIITCPIDQVLTNELGFSVADAIPTNDQYNCTADWPVMPPLVLFECSEYTWEVTYKVADQFGNPPPGTQFIDDNITGTYPNFVINDLPVGPVWLRYVVKDECGLSTECRTELIIEDASPPTAVCDLHSNIALDENGWAYAGPETFDDGSFSCGDVTLKIRRVTPGECPEVGSQTAFTDLIKFCCADANSTVMIELQVTSVANGQTATCMIEAFVQDNSNSSFNEPADLSVTVPCGFSFPVNSQSQLNSLYGTPSFSSGICTGSFSEILPAVVNNGDCGSGTLTRKWSYTAASGQVFNEAQVITFTNSTPFTLSEITFPADYSVTGCAGMSVIPEDLPTANGFPTYNPGACSDVFASYDDLVFYDVENTCIKIVRTWTVVDWCAFNGNPGVGIWEKSQIIKISDNTPPVITSGCSLPAVLSGDYDNCSHTLDFTATGNDSCPGTLLWSATIDGVSQTVTVDGDQATISNATLGIGSHTICWTLTDGCDNVDSCCETFSLRDIKAPTPTCVSAITTVIESANGPTTIWASDFEASSFDDCSSMAQLDFAFSSNPNDQFMSFTCADLPNGISDTLEIDIYVFDAAGNFDFCPTMLVLQDNSDYCTDVIGTGNRVGVTGHVYTETDVMVEDVMVELNADMPDFPSMNMTDTDGGYAFSNLEMYEDYNVHAERNDDHMSGVSTIDLVLIQKHLLGIQALDSPYKVIAADINNSGHISAIDLIDLRKLILGIYDELPNNSSWRFVDAAFEFSNPSDPFPYDESMSYPSLDAVMTNVDFIAVKIGDVNSSIDLSNATGNVSNRNNNPLLLSTEDISFTANESIAVPFRMDDQNDLIGMQFTIEYDADQFQFNGITSDVIDITEANFALLQEGVVTVSYDRDEAITVTKDQTLFNLQLTTKKSGSSLDLIKIGSLITNAEAYVLQDNTITETTIAITSDNQKDGFALYQNIPNPFKDNTIIGFDLPEASTATLTVYDATGRVIFAKTDDFVKGYNELQVNASTFTNSGILYYQLNSYTHTATRKMIVIK